MVTADGEVEVDDYGTDTTTIVIPKEVTFKEKTYKVRALAKKAFYQNKTLTSVTIESGIKEIPEQAFMECSSLTKLVIGDGIEKIGDSAFEGCKKLEEVTVPKSVKEIGKSVFKDWESLKKIVFEGNLKKIDENLFKNCNKLEELEIQGDIELIEEKRKQEQQRHLKTFEEDSKLEVLNGRYGPYINYDGTNYRLPKALHARATELTYEECMKVVQAAPAKKK